MNLRIQPISRLVLATPQKKAAKDSKAAKKLGDVVLTPWDFEKKLNEPNTNKVKKFTGGGDSESSSCTSLYGDLLPMGFAC